MSVSVHEAFCLDSAQDRYWFIDHFLGDQIQDEWDITTTGGSAVVVDQQTGGIIRLTTGATTNNSTQIDWNDIRSLHVDQKVSMELRIKLNPTLVMDVLLALQFDTSNRIDFWFDNAANVNWYIRCIDGGVGGLLDSGIVADTSYHIFRIECLPAGEVHFYIDGTETANSPITTNIPDDATDYLQPRLFIRTNEDVAKSMDVDYVACRQDR